LESVGASEPDSELVSEGKRSFDHRTGLQEDSTLIEKTAQKLTITRKLDSPNITEVTNDSTEMDFDSLKVRDVNSQSDGIDSLDVEGGIRHRTDQYLGLRHRRCRLKESVSSIAPPSTVTSKSLKNETGQSGRLVSSAKWSLAPIFVGLTASAVVVSRCALALSAGMLYLGIYMGSGR